MWIAMFIVAIVAIAAIALLVKRINFLKTEVRMSNILLERVLSDLEYSRHSWEYGLCMPACSYCAKEEREAEFEQQYSYIPLWTDTARLQEEYEEAYEYELFYKCADLDLERLLKLLEKQNNKELF